MGEKIITVTKRFHSVQIRSLSQLMKPNRPIKKWRFPQPKVVDWQAAWPFSTLVVRLGSSLGSPCFITCCPCYWFNSASSRQTLTGPDTGVIGARSRVTRSMTSSGLFAIGWWSVTSWLIDRWVKSMLRLARKGNHGWWNHNCPRRKTIKDDWSYRSYIRNMIKVFPNVWN